MPLFPHHHHHRQPWAQLPLVSDAVVTIAAHHCLSRAAWLNSCKVAPHYCSVSSDHSRWGRPFLFEPSIIPNTRVFIFLLSSILQIWPVPCTAVFVFVFEGSCILSAYMHLFQKPVSVMAFGGNDGKVYCSPCYKNYFLHWCTFHSVFIFHILQLHSKFLMKTGRFQQESMGHFTFWLRLSLRLFAEWKLKLNAKVCT